MSSPSSPSPSPSPSPSTSSPVAFVTAVPLFSSSPSSTSFFSSSSSSTPNTSHYNKHFPNSSFLPSKLPSLTTTARHSRLHNVHTVHAKASHVTSTTSFPSSSPSSSSSKSTSSTLSPEKATVSPSPIPISKSRSTYDYIIVGGGAAGCVLANRLSAEKDKRVLLIETGPSAESFILNMPLGFPKLLGSSLDVALTTNEEPELNNRRLYFPRGKLLGGSHAISVMLYHRGDAKDYNKWSEMCGDTQWDSDGVLPYFMKSEHQQNLKLLSEHSHVHSDQGYLSVDNLQFINPISSAFVDASKQHGIQENIDFNNWETDQQGVGLFQVTQKNGNRATPATSYLNPVRNRSNLTVMSNCTVERVAFDTETNGTTHAPIASSIILVDSDGRRVQIKASREIILSAGVYGSPQLLMLSGIGPKEDLNEFGILPIHYNESVGKNLQDHAASMLTYHSPNPYEDKKKTSVYYTEETGKDPNIIMNYLFNGKGPLTSPMCEAGAFVRTKSGLESCDLQIRFVPFFSEPDPYGSLAAFANGGTYLQNVANRPAGFSIQSVVTRPSSKGHVKLRSIDVRDSLQIYANWMSNESDMHTLIEGMKICRDIANHDALSPYRGKEIHPGIDVQDDALLEKYIRETCHTANAMVGTCAMGNGANGVVDSNLKVKGVERLRVIDSSIMPTLPGGQSGAPTMMIAEKGADLIINAATSVRLSETSSV